MDKPLLKYNSNKIMKCINPALVRTDCKLDSDILGLIKKNKKIYIIDVIYINNHTRGKIPVILNNMPLYGWITLEHANKCFFI